MPIVVSSNCEVEVSLKTYPQEHIPPPIFGQGQQKKFVRNPSVNILGFSQLNGFLQGEFRQEADLSTNRQKILASHPKPTAWGTKVRGVFLASPIIKKLITIIVLCLLMGGCISVVPQTPNQGQEVENQVQLTNPTPNSVSVQPDSKQTTTVTALVAEVLPVKNDLTPTPFSLPQPTATLIPSATPTLVILDTPTLPPPPSSTALPTSTDTSTPMPSPTTSSSPTAANMPATLQPTATSQPGIKYVVIISIDGLRPDALVMSHTPNLDELIAQGAYNPHAQTLSLSITLPSHASMLSGMVAEKHGIVWGLPYIGWPGMAGPTLFSEAHDAGLSTAMVFGKEKLNYLALPNSVDKIFGIDAHDPEVRDHALEFIHEGLPNVLFIHFPDTDRVGHTYGWMSTNQFQSVTFVDALIGEIVAALEEGGYLNNTLLIITADHGGHGFGHGDDSPLDRTIPWLAVGPGVPSGVTLTRHINTYDTAATALYGLNLPIPEKWDGQPILENGFTPAI